MFHRRISAKFIENLNRVYDESGTWWRKIVDDKDVFIAIRQDYIDVYYKGGALLKVIDAGKGKINCLIHQKYLLVADEENEANYRSLTRPPRGTPGVGLQIRDLAAFSENYVKIKSNVQRLAGIERKVENDIASRADVKLGIVIDMEIAFSKKDIKDTDAMSGDAILTARASNYAPGIAKSSRVRVPSRMDFAMMTADGSLLFFELKLYENPELRSKDSPPVVDQLRAYTNLLQNQTQAIERAYQGVLESWRDLHGTFFKRRSQLASTKLRVDTHPRLLIVDFDDDQKKGYLEKTMMPNIFTQARQKGLGLERNHVICLQTVSSIGQLLPSTRFSSSS